MKGIVVDHVTPDMELFREESFAPQVSITRAKDTDEAITLANDTEYGLSAAIFTRDIARGLAARQAHRNAASATSTAPPWPTRRRCRSAA